jgi:hypothetical protein
VLCGGNVFDDVHREHDQPAERIDGEDARGAGGGLAGVGGHLQMIIARGEAGNRESA